MKKKIQHKSVVFTIIATVWMMSSNFSYGQPMIKWEANYGGSYSDQSWSMTPSRDGGYLITGFSCSINDQVIGNPGRVINWVVKIDSVGHVQWKKTYGQSFLVNYLYSVEQTTDGGYILAGSVDSDTTQQYGGNFDYNVTRMDSLGNIIWSKRYGGSSADEAYSIKQTLDGGYIVNGYTESTDTSGDVHGGHGSFDYWILKLDSLGSIEWQKCLGGSHIDFGTSIVQNADGTYLAGGYSESNDSGVVIGYRSFDYWVVKLDHQGNILWQKKYGGNGYDQLFALQKTTDGGYILAGYTNSDGGSGDVSENYGDYDYWLVKIDSIGKMQWQKSLGGSGHDVALTVIQTIEGGYLAAGTSNSNNHDVSRNYGGYDCWLVKLNSLGSLTWQMSLGGTADDEAHSIHQTDDSGYVFSGFSTSHNGDVPHNFGGQDYLVMKLECPRDSESHVLINDTVLVNRIISIDTLSLLIAAERAELSDSIVQMIRVTDYVFDATHFQITMTTYDTIMNSVSECDGSIVHVSNHSGAVVVDSEFVTRHYFQSRDTSYELIPYKTTSVDVNSEASRVLVYPNPFTKVFIVDIGNNQTAKVTLVDNLGRLVFAGECFGKTKITLPNLCSGMYFVTTVMPSGISVVTKLNAVSE